MANPAGEQPGARVRRAQTPPPRRDRAATRPPVQPPVSAEAPTTPSPNLNAVAASATRLGLTVGETPASVDVINQQTMQDQGYRTNVETAQGMVGVLAVDSAGAPGGFSMRGFEFDQINVLYNGISLGPQDLTGRVMDTFVFDRVEVLKGASALESGQGAIGGSVNYVNKLPTTGPVQNEAFTSYDFARFDSFRVRVRRQHATSGPRLSVRYELRARQQLHRR